MLSLAKGVSYEGIGSLFEIEVDAEIPGHDYLMLEEDGGHLDPLMVVLRSKKQFHALNIADLPITVHDLSDDSAYRMQPRVDGSLRNSHIFGDYRVGDRVWSVVQIL